MDPFRPDIIPQNQTLAECKAELLKSLEAQEQSRINPLDFRGVEGFSDGEIVTDIKKVEEKRKEINRKLKLLNPEEFQKYEDSKIVESLLLTSISESKWLGANTQLLVPSLFDDYFRGIDMITELTKDPQDPRRIGFGVDFTISREQAAKKMAGIMERLQKGFVPSVKYFDSPTTGKQKEMLMPKVILCADPSSVKRVADTYVEALYQNESVAGILERDPIQFVLLDEIRAQLTALSNISYEYFNNQKAGDIYRQSSVAFNAVMKERGIDIQMLKIKSRGDTLHGALVSMIAKYDRERK